MTPDQKAQARELVKAGVHPSVALRRVLGLAAFPELKSGNDVATMADNAVLLMRHGLSKSLAMMHALHAGGYRPPLKSAPPGAKRPFQRPT